MNRPLRLIFPLAALASLPLATPIRGAEAQMASERAELRQDLSDTKIVINYSRPSARGRDTIFGGEVHWDEVWTPGANMSTTIHFSKDVTLGGHEVKAGTYGIWIQVRQDQDWLFMLHPDTTLFHVPHAKIEDGLLNFPVTPEPAPFRETLTWDVQRIRALGGVLEMHWAGTRVQVPVTVDLGETLTMTAEEARPYLGTWRLTRLKTFSDSAEAEWKKDMSPEEIAEFDAWFTPTDATILHDPERNWLVIEDEPEEPGPDGLLMPRGSHQFRPGWIWRDELVQIEKGAIVTFTVDASGVATTAEMRERNDRLAGTLERIAP